MLIVSQQDQVVADHVLTTTPWPWQVPGGKRPLLGGSRGEPRDEDTGEEEEGAAHPLAGGGDHEQQQRGRHQRERQEWA